MIRKAAVGGKPAFGRFLRLSYRPRSPGPPGDERARRTAADALRAGERRGAPPARPAPHVAGAPRPLPPHPRSPPHPAPAQAARRGRLWVSRRALSRLIPPPHTHTPPQPPARPQAAGKRPRGARVAAERGARRGGTGLVRGLPEGCAEPWAGSAAPGARGGGRTRRAENRRGDNQVAEPGYCYGRGCFEGGEGFRRAYWREVLFPRRGQKPYGVYTGWTWKVHWAWLSGLHPCFACGLLSPLSLQSPV